MIVEPLSPQFLKQLQRLKIHTRRTFLGTRQGSHASPRRGQGLEFSDYRLYTAGDDFRHIDWKILARNDRVYVKEFREEQDLSVLLLIDGSASMGVPEEKIRLANSIALALGFIALADGDRVTFASLGNGRTPRYVGARAIHRAALELGKFSPLGDFSPIDEVRSALASQRLPGKCFFLTDLLFPLPEVIQSLELIRAKNFDLSVIQLLSPEELAPPSYGDSVLVDAETAEELSLTVDPVSYQRKLNEHLTAVEHHAHRLGATFLQVSTTDSLSEILLQRLTQIGVLR